MSRIEIDVQCPACDGTGVYVGLAERHGAGVVCRQCKGTGCYRFTYEYEIFTGRKEHQDVKRVYECNPGFVIGDNPNMDLTLLDFGGIPYEDFIRHGYFPHGSEDRERTCPKWWTQCAGKEGPDWEECYSSLGRRFKDCDYFSEKEKCWGKWDQELGVVSSPGESNS